MRHTGRLLHDEHRANLELLARVESALGRATRDAAALRDLLGALARQVEGDLGRHFAFEEAELFPRLDAAGDGPIAALLADEHAAIRDVAAELLPLARQAQAGVLDDAAWGTLRSLVAELVERQVAHIQKEEMALLPMLEDLLDDETDRRLALDYAAA